MRLLRDIKPLVKPKLRRLGNIWHCYATTPIRTAAGLAYTPARAYAEWIRIITEDGLYWEFFK